MTQIDVARAVGVHSTTVSLALRNSPSIPDATRRRILAAAEKLGYVPDPALRALAAYRKHVLTPRRTETIAYVTHCPTKWEWRDNPADEQCFRGAEHKALESGYQLEHFWLGAPGMSGRRLSNVFFHRAISGVILAPARGDDSDRLGFDWDRLTAVKIGHPSHTSGLHHVSSDPTGDVRHAVRQARAAGFRRIGLILPQKWDDCDDQAWSIGFEVEQRHVPATQQIPILFNGGPEIGHPRLDRRQDDEIDPAKLARWLSEFRPDLVIGSVRFTGGPLARLGIRIPRDIAFIDLLHQGSDPTLAGIRPNFHRIGEVAAEILIGQLQLNAHGLPPFPTRTLVLGAWCDGASISPSHTSSPGERSSAQPVVESSVAV